eukprot:XP_011665539.1 PREDICTED: carboxypeptidase D isoform X2 [Strongylocentrotus purpuratus]
MMTYLISTRSKMGNIKLIQCVFLLVLLLQTLAFCSAFSALHPLNRIAELWGKEAARVGPRTRRSAAIDTKYYHSYDDLTHLLRLYSNEYPSITNLSSIGQSVQGKELWVMQITDKPGVVENEEPMFKYVGNMHGNEVIGRQILIYLIEYLLLNYGTDERVTRLVDETNIYIMPTMNPDGFHMAHEGECSGTNGRENAHAVDLNRNFPDQFHTSPADKWKGREKETMLMMKWIESNPFVLSSNLHGGSLVASYPFDDTRNHNPHQIGRYSKSPDDALFKKLARVYSNNHLVMHSNPGCPGYPSESFAGGITNGAQWYDVPGGMQDFNYVNSNCFEITVELSCCKYPPVGQLTQEWENNRPALLAYMEMVHIGVKGSVLDSFDGSGIEGAKISVQGIDHDVVSVHYGNYWRLLLPGTYHITVKADGYFSLSRDVVVTENEVTRVNFRLRSRTTFIEPVPIEHHTQESMIEALTNVADRYPNITHLYSIGNSVQDRQIMAIEISDRPGVHEPGEPEMKYVAGIHGNEVVGGEMLMLFIQFLCENYETSDQVKWLVDNTRIHLVPSMNPDGKAIAFEGDIESTVGRNNYRGVDLNRNFPDRFGRSEGTIQPETKAIMDWTKNHPFVISAGLHGGSLVANYPYDSNRQQVEGYSASPDDAMFKQLALAFANSHGVMYKGFPCPVKYPDEKFEGGITNGALWYLVDGGMQDWNYVNTNAMEVTVEMSCVKFPLTAELPQYWNDNKMSLISFIHEAHRGIQGFVLDKAGKGLSHAHIIVEGIDHNVSTAKFGDFWRPLTPGFYNVTAHAEGYALETQEVIVYPGLASQVNFTLATEGSEGSNEGQLDIPLDEWAVQYDFSIAQNFSGYQTNDNLARVLLEYQGSYPDIIDLSPLGQTRSGTSMWMLEMGTNRKVDSVIDIPRVALIGGLRGEEPVGRELLWRFIHHLGEGYHANDERVVRLLNTTHLTIIPAVDYDGFGLAHEGDCTGSRYEGDLTANSFGPDGELLSQRPELVALQSLFTDHNFTLVLSIESSGMWVRYPYDNPTGDHGTTTEDNNLFFEIANAYASANSILSGGVKCNSHSYGAGVVNGAEWKNIRNTLQDYLYTQKSEFMVTAQISCCKYPGHGELENLWRTNLESLTAFTEKSHQGIIGKIQTADGSPLTSAVIHHGDHTHVLAPDEDGMFRRLLPVGVHGVTASAPGYMPLTKDVHVTMNEVSEVVFLMEKEPGMRYHHFDEMKEMLNNLTSLYPRLTHLQSIGESVEGRPLLVLELGNKPGNHQPGRPEVKFIGSIHGNEPVGRELVLSLANYLLMNYGKDDGVTKLLDTTHIHILPSMNPDGSEKTKMLQGTCFGDEGKTNANGINLENDYQMNVLNMSADVQPETRAITDWLKSRPFTLGVSLFGGTVVARYPYNSQKGGDKIVQTSDDKLFQQLAKAYANKHPTMHLGNPQCPGNAEESYQHGIVNGAEWNAQENNIQDFTYDSLGCLDLSVHTCCCLYPKASELQDIWKAHRPALLETIIQAHRGIQGVVTTTAGTPLEGATISISGLHRNHVLTSHQGDFWLLLPDGQYSITVSAEGHSSETLPAVVSGREVMVLKFTLPEESTIMGFPIYLFLGMLALSFALVLLSVVCIARCCRSKTKQGRRTRGFYQLDQGKMFAEEYHDEVALKTFRNGDKKSLLKNMEFHDFSATDSEDDETFKR